MTEKVPDEVANAISVIADCVNVLIDDRLPVQYVVAILMRALFTRLIALPQKERDFLRKDIAENFDDVFGKLEKMYRD